MCPRATTAPAASSDDRTDRHVTRGQGQARLRQRVTHGPGLLQYIAPTMMFMLAVWYFGEEMPPGRWVGFALVWVALIVLTVDGWRSRSRVAVTPVTEPV